MEMTEGMERMVLRCREVFKGKQLLETWMGDWILNRKPQISHSVSNLIIHFFLLQQAACQSKNTLFQLAGMASIARLCPILHPLIQDFGIFLRDSNGTIPSTLPRCYHTISESGLSLIGSAALRVYRNSDWCLST